MKTIFVVTQENESWGSVRWFLEKDKPSAWAMFNAYKEAIEPGDYIAIFTMPVPDGMSHNRITELADLEMWDVGPHYLDAIQRIDARTPECQHGPKFEVVA